MQHGTQRRSWPWVQEAVKAVQDGEIGPVHVAHSWSTNRRPSIGRGERTAPPPTLDWALWREPAPERPFASNVVPYNWHWWWHWGNGELGNNGVHGLDVARWALGVTFPTRVVSSEGRWYHDDDQETPNTMSVAYEFPGGTMITWEGHSCSPLGPQASSFGVSFHGPDASLVIDTEGWRILDRKNKPVVEQEGTKKDDLAHVADFLVAIRGGRQPNADIAEGHTSELLCHLGNIALRTDRVLHTRPEDGRILGVDEAAEPEEAVRGMRVTTAYPQGSADIESSTSRREAITAQVVAQGVALVESIEKLLDETDFILLETNDGRPHLGQIRPVLAAARGEAKGILAGASAR